MKTQHIVRAALTAGLSFALMGTSVPTIALAATAQERLDEATAAREAASAELEDAQAYLDSLSSQFDASFAEFELRQAELVETREQISDTESQIDAKEDELVVARAALSQSVADGYKTGSSLLSFIFGSTSFDDLVSRIHYANKVTEAQAAAIETVRTIEGELEEHRSELVVQQETQEEQTERAREAADEVQGLMTVQESYVNGLSAEVQNQLAIEEAARQEIAEEQARKEAEERAAREAEERAAAEAAQAQTQSQSQSQEGTGEQSQTSDSSSQSTASTSTEGSSEQTSVADYGSGVYAAIDYAKSQLGVSYSWAGRAIANQEFDCSGLVWWAFRQAGISIPRGQRMANGASNSMIGWCLSNGGWTTSQANLQPGDLMFWGSSVDSTNHVGIYIGDGRMIHSSWAGVEITSAYYNAGSFVGGGPVV